MRTQTLTKTESLHSHLNQQCVVVLAVIKSALCSQAIVQLESFLPATVNIILVNIYDHPDFQREHRVTAVPTGYVFKQGQLTAEFNMPFDQDQILCWIN
jgi:thioredoxin-like negative regulator of GroEL